MFCFPSSRKRTMVFTKGIFMNFPPKKSWKYIYTLIFFVHTHIYIYLFTYIYIFIYIYIYTYRFSSICFVFPYPEKKRHGKNGRQGEKRWKSLFGDLGVAYATPGTGWMVRSLVLRISTRSQFVGSWDGWLTPPR